jgi:hypothetical protein
MTNKPSTATIKKPLQALRNLQHLYAKAREHITKLEEIIHLQDEQIVTQAEQNQVLQKLVKAQSIRIAELETTVFGKKKDKGKKPPDSAADGVPGSSPKIPPYEALPDLTPGYVSHLVTKYVIEHGICSARGKRTSGHDLGGQAVTLSSNVRLLVCHLISLQS